MSSLDKSIHLIPGIIFQENYFWEIILQCKTNVLFLSSLSYNSSLIILIEYGYVLKELFIFSFHSVLRHLPSPLSRYRVTVEGIFRVR